jgi:hypothetical protein
MAEVESGDDKAAAVELNKQTQDVYKALQDAWFGLDLINVDAYVKENPNLFQEEEVIDTKDTLDSIIEGSLNKNNIRRVK